MADPIEEAELAIDSNEVNVTVLRLALRSLIEHAKASDAARDEVQEKIAYLRRGCMYLPDQELRQKISAVDSAEWKFGYYWNTLVAAERDRATRAEFAQRDAESERDALQARIDQVLALTGSPGPEATRILKGENARDRRDAARELRDVGREIEPSDPS